MSRLVAPHLNLVMTPHDNCVHDNCEGKRRLARGLATELRCPSSRCSASPRAKPSCWHVPRTAWWQNGGDRQVGLNIPMFGCLSSSWLGLFHTTTLMEQALGSIPPLPAHLGPKMHNVTSEGKRSWVKRPSLSPFTKSAADLLSVKAWVTLWVSR